MNISIALEDFLENLESLNRRPRTIQTYEQRLKRFISWLTTDSTTRVNFRHINKYVVSLRRQKTLYKGHPTKPEITGGLSDATILGHIQALKTFWLWCESVGYCESSPAAHLDRPSYDPSTNEKIISPSDFQKTKAMIEEMKQSKNAEIIRNRAIWLYIVETACRVGEAASLTLDTVGIETPENIENELVYESEIYGKTKKGVVYYTEETAIAIRKYLLIRPECKTEKLWVGVNNKHVGNPLTESGIYQVFAKIAKAAGVKKNYGPQSMRHLNGFTYTSKGNLALAQSKLRHKAVTTTARFYAHQNNLEVKRATAKSMLLQL